MRILWQRLLSACRRPLSALRRMAAQGLPPALRERAAALLSPAIQERPRYVLPAVVCVLTLAVILTAAATDAHRSAADPGGPDELPPPSDGTGDAPEAVDLRELLSTEGLRMEQVLAAAAEEADTVFLLSTDGLREEQALSYLPDEEIEEETDDGIVHEADPGDDASAAMVALLDDGLYAFVEEEDRWIVIDSAPAGNSGTFSASENAERVYTFAKEVLGVNTAAACGILGNLRHESGFDPHAVFVEADGRVSYGICQWNAGRLIALREFCQSHGYDPTTLSGQLQYLAYELNGRERAAFNRVRSVPDTGNGAYEAGYLWARYFERCAARYHPARAETAYSTYWAKYGDTDARFVLSIIGETYPSGTLAAGTDVELHGVIRSDEKIVRISAFVYDASGTVVLSYKQDWSSVRYDLQKDGLDRALDFGKLGGGSYTYEVYATDASGATKTLVRSSFKMGGVPAPQVPIPADTVPETPVPAPGEIPVPQVPVPGTAETPTPAPVEIPDDLPDTIGPDEIAAPPLPEDPIPETPDAPDGSEDQDPTPVPEELPPIPEETPDPVGPDPVPEETPEEVPESGPDDAWLPPSVHPAAPPAPPAPVGPADPVPEETPSVSEETLPVPEETELPPIPEEEEIPVPEEDDALSDDEEDGASEDAWLPPSAS